MREINARWLGLAISIIGIYILTIMLVIALCMQGLSSQSDVGVAAGIFGVAIALTTVFATVPYVFKCAKNLIIKKEG